MDKIWTFIVDFFENNILAFLKKYFLPFFKETKLWYFVTVVIFVAICVYIEYTYHIDREITKRYYGQPFNYSLASFAMYAIPFIGTYLLHIVFYKRYDLLRNWRFWVLVVFALTIYSFRSGWYGYRDWIAHWFSAENYYYAMRTGNQIAQGLLLFIPLTMFWLIIHRRQMPLYGFKIKGVNLWPYYFMLIGMIPLIAWASFQSDFLEMYPIYQRIIPEGFSTTMGVIKVFFFEICYGFDFVMTEFFFRGFLILAFAKIAGRACILPMVTFYVFIHFGKPLGETCSSFFGGTILGILAYETQSIIGGTIAHLGTAWMMETGGTFGRELHLGGK